MLPECCIHLISSPTITGFYFATVYADRVVVSSECMVYSAFLSFWHASDSCVSYK